MVTMAAAHMELLAAKYYWDLGIADGLGVETTFFPPSHT
eukprot:COSAG05_NODE_478_length_9434_cov_5.178897_5_plen_39_part_00